MDVVINGGAGFSFRLPDEFKPGLKSGKASAEVIGVPVIRALYSYNSND